jgi:hypothetical protein
MKVSEALRAARSKIESPEHWVQESFAQDKSGRGVESRSDAGVKFCLLGSIQHICWLYDRDDEWFLADLVTNCSHDLFHQDPVYVNDYYHEDEDGVQIVGAAHKNVLTILDCAIGRAEVSEADTERVLATFDHAVEMVNS